MNRQERIFELPARKDVVFSLGDGVVLLVIAVLLYLGIQLATDHPAVIQGPEISLEPVALPFYALLSLGRMLAAYVLSLVFSIFYGYVAARNLLARSWLIPLLDVLQSVPILSFLPVVLMSLTAILPQTLAVELSAIILIFTSQVWNLTFSFYQSMTTLPMELREVAAVFRFSPWLRFIRLELPFASIGLIWNSVMAWAGGWFFLMAAEIFTLGERDFRLPGLGAYLQTAANQGNTTAVFLGIVTLIVIIVVFDQLVWQPLLAWAEQFKVSQVEQDQPTTSWFLESIQHSRIAKTISGKFLAPIGQTISALLNHPPRFVRSLEPPPTNRRPWVAWGIGAVLLAGIGYGALHAVILMSTIPVQQWTTIAVGLVMTLLRVLCAVGMALIWTVPLGVFIGTNPRAAKVIQPIVQTAASVPATALFPILVLGLYQYPGGDNLAAILLMSLGTQWYLLFNVIAGAAAIPQDLHYTSDLLGLRGWKRWQTLILPALFPYIITGLITASGGAWNASIVAEYTHFGGSVHRVTGIGAMITESTDRGDHALLLASTLAMVFTVVAINRLVWRQLYQEAEYRYRMDQ